MPPHSVPLPRGTVSQHEKTIFRKRGEAVGWALQREAAARWAFSQRFRAVTFSRSDSDVPGYENVLLYTIGDFP